MLLDNRFYTCIIKRYEFPVDHVKCRKAYLDERMCHVDKLSANQLDVKFKSDQDYLDEVNNIALSRIKDSKKTSLKQGDISPSGKISSSSKASWNSSSSSSNTSSLTIFKNKKRHIHNTGSLNNRHDNDSERKKRLSKSIVFKFNNNIPVDYEFIKFNRLKYSNFYSNCNLVKQDVDKMNIVNNLKFSQINSQNGTYYRQQKSQIKNINHSL